MIPPLTDDAPKLRHQLLLALLPWLILALAFLPQLARAEDEPRFEPTSRHERAADLRPLFEEYAWPVDVAMDVAWCESRLDPGAVNPTSGATGLMQLLGWQGFANRLFGRWVSLKDAAVNLRIAFALWEDSGGRFGFHWYASRACWGGW